MREEWIYSPSPAKIYFDKSKFTQQTTYYVRKGKIQFQTNNPCVYKILNMRTGKIYIGTTSALISRLHTHYRQLLNGKHFCEEMQHDFDNGDLFCCSVCKFGQSFYDEQTAIGEYMALGASLYNLCISKRANAMIPQAMTAGYR